MAMEISRATWESICLDEHHHSAFSFYYTLNLNTRFQDVNVDHAEGLKVWNNAEPCGKRSEEAPRSSLTKVPKHTYMEWGLLARNAPPKPLHSKASSTTMTVLIMRKLLKANAIAKINRKNNSSVQSNYWEYYNLNYKQVRLNLYVKDSMGTIMDGHRAGLTKHHHCSRWFIVNMWGKETWLFVLSDTWQPGN